MGSSNPHLLLLVLVPLVVRRPPRPIHPLSHSNNLHMCHPLRILCHVSPVIWFQVILRTHRHHTYLPMHCKMEVLFLRLLHPTVHDPRPNSWHPARHPLSVMLLHLRFNTMSLYLYHRTQGRILRQAVRMNTLSRDKCIPCRTDWIDCISTRRELSCRVRMKMTF